MGDLFVCGYGDVGQLGLGIIEMEKSTPTFVETKQVIIDICAGGMHSLFLTQCGKVFAFGCNDDFALGRETANDGISEFTPQLVTLSDEAVKISAGESHSACLLKNGSVWFWGTFRDSFGCMNFAELGCSKKPLQIQIGKMVKDIASGANHLVILAHDGVVYTLGCGEQGQLGRTPLRSSSRNSRHSKILLNPEPVYVKHKLLKAENIWCTPYGTFIRQLQTGVIFAFGLNNYKQLTDLESNSLIEFHPKPILLQNIRKIAGGEHHTLILTNDNKVYSMGRMHYGRLGIGLQQEHFDQCCPLTEIDFFEPTIIEDIICGSQTSFAISNEGKLFAWGFGTTLQLGLGHENDVFSPVALSLKQNLERIKVLKVASDSQHTLIIACKQTYTQ